jgi:hypothetical protein
MTMNINHVAFKILASLVATPVLSAGTIIWWSNAWAFRGDSCWPETFGCIAIGIIGLAFPIGALAAIWRVDIGI